MPVAMDDGAKKSEPTFVHECIGSFGATVHVLAQTFMESFEAVEPNVNLDDMNTPLNSIN